MTAPKLISGPYVQPQAKPGDWLDDEIDGQVQVGGWTGAPLPWPRRKKTGRPSLILTAEMARAVRVTDGTRQLLQERTGVPAEAAERGRTAAAMPEARTKMANTKRGVPAPLSVRAGLLRAAKAPKPTRQAKTMSDKMRGMLSPG